MFSSCLVDHSVAAPPPTQVKAHAPRRTFCFPGVAQVLDLQWQDRQLCGFSGGFATTGSDYYQQQHPWPAPRLPVLDPAV